MYGIPTTLDHRGRCLTHVGSTTGSSILLYQYAECVLLRSDGWRVQESKRKRCSVLSQAEGPDIVDWMYSVLMGKQDRPNSFVITGVIQIEENRTKKMVDLWKVVRIIWL